MKNDKSNELWLSRFIEICSKNWVQFYHKTDKTQFEEMIKFIKSETIKFIKFNSKKLYHRELLVFHYQLVIMRHNNRPCLG